MGKILSAGEGLASVRAKVRRGGGGAGCGPELAAYLACLDAKDRDEEACRGVRDAANSLAKAKSARDGAARSAAKDASKKGKAQAAAKAAETAAAKAKAAAADAAKAGDALKAAEMKVAELEKSLARL